MSNMTLAQAMEVADKILPLSETHKATKVLAAEIRRRDGETCSSCNKRDNCFIWAESSMPFVDFGCRSWQRREGSDGRQITHLRSEVCHSGRGIRRGIMADRGAHGPDRGEMVMVEFKNCIAYDARPPGEIIAYLKAELAALRAKLEQAEAAYQELNVRLAGVEAERDHYRVVATNRTNEALDVLAERVRELEQEPRHWSAQNGKCPAAEMSTEQLVSILQDGPASALTTRIATDILREAGNRLADRDRLRGMWAKLREWVSPSGEESEHVSCHAVIAKMDALERGE
jgi:hypothetical protein